MELLVGRRTFTDVVGVTEDPYEWQLTEKGLIGRSTGHIVA